MQSDCNKRLAVILTSSQHSSKGEGQEGVIDFLMFYKFQGVANPLLWKCEVFIEATKNIYARNKGFR
jgi:hypothetical protein